MTVDPRALAELLEESQDLQADAMRPTRAQTHPPGHFEPQQMAQCRLRLTDDTKISGTHVHATRLIASREISAFS